MVLADSHGISRVPRYSGTRRKPIRCHLPGCHRLWPTVPDRSISKLVGNSPPLKAAGPYNPTVQAQWFGLCPRSLAATSGITICFLFLWVLRWFTSPRCLQPPMYSAEDTPGLARVGFPIRKSPGQSLFAAHRGLSQLIASFIG